MFNNTWLGSLVLAGLLASAAAQAQSLPAPKEFYFDEDRATTRAVVAVNAQGDALVDRLTAAIQRNPQASDARAQLAHVAFAGDRRELGEQLYQAALGNLAGNSPLRRTVAWNYGWDLYRAGDAQAAVGQWSQLAEGRPSAPQWLPPTLALGLWSAGRTSEAVVWYAAAVRTWPDRWGDSANFPQLLPEWSEAERATLAEVLAAYAANPPAWP